MHDVQAAVAAAPAAATGVASTRSYDITITYDVHYSVRDREYINISIYVRVCVLLFHGS
jgi:hypothetical protein